MHAKRNKIAYNTMYLFLRCVATYQFDRRTIIYKIFICLIEKKIVSLQIVILTSIYNNY